MKIDQHLIVPSFIRTPHFISAEKTENFCWNCITCQAPMVITFENASNLYWNDIGNITKEEYSYLKEIYEVGYVGKSHDGGYPYFIQINCQECRQAHMLYLGIKEPLNSCLHITIQAVSLIHKKT